MNCEEPPRGYAPKGSFYSAERVDYPFFENKSEDSREKILIESMPFLHSLIYKKIELAVIERKKSREEKSKQTPKSTDLPIPDKRLISTIPAESMEGLSHLENTFSSSVDDHQLKHVRVTNELDITYKSPCSLRLAQETCGT